MSQASTGDADVLVVGAERPPIFRDLYHLFLRVSWWQALGGIVAAYMAINVVYGALYFAFGGIANARPDSFFDAFVFSVQTVATIGYGSMAPATPLANVLVVSEAVVGLLITAVSTGLVFSKFTMAPSMVVFSSHAVIGPMNGKPTLSVRVGNMRGNLIVDTVARVYMMRTERTAEGVVWYRMIDLPLERERMPALTRSWAMLHTIDERSPLFRATPESIATDEVELVVTISGVDDTSMQAVHARKRFYDKDVMFGARFADTMHVREDGRLIFDVRRFDDVVPTAPTSDFPFPKSETNGRV